MLKRTMLTLFACGAATVAIRHGPLEPNGIAERLGIASAWMLGVLWLIREAVVQRRRAS